MDVPDAIVPYRTVPYHTVPTYWIDPVCAPHSYFPTLDRSGTIVKVLVSRHREHGDGGNGFQYRTKPAWSVLLQRPLNEAVEAMTASQSGPRPGEFHVLHPWAPDEDWHFDTIEWR
jgi:hypothetical protein